MILLYLSLQNAGMRACQHFGEMIFDVYKKQKPVKPDWRKRVVLGLFFLLILAGSVFALWANNSYPLMQKALAALEPDQNIQASQQPWIIFQPVHIEPTTGIIFYPGARVDARSYAPTLRNLAQEGYLTVIVPMPLNLAFTGINKAEAVMEAYPEIQTWVLGGHSLGGAMAANYAYNNPGKLAGLILYASYPAENNRLADRDLPVFSIYGDLDFGAERMAASPQLLPADALFVVIEGGNHAQFGYYGLQPGDGIATISREDQQAQILRHTLTWLEQFEKP